MLLLLLIMENLLNAFIYIYNVSERRGYYTQGFRKRKTYLGCGTLRITAI